MDDSLVRVLRVQVADQCRVALTGLTMIEWAVAKLDGGVVDHDRLWVGCEIFIGGAGKVSRILWGAGPDRGLISTRRKPLRESLEVLETSALYDIAMRDNFERLDERVELWAATSRTARYADKVVSSAANPGGRELDKIDRFRIYDPSGPRIAYWGQSFDIPSIAGECRRLQVATEDLDHEPP